MKIKVLKTIKYLLILIAIVSQAVLLSAFEAHVINITAKIELPPMCDALSIGYYRNHEGCTNGGNGSSVWANEVNALSSSEFSGVFTSYTGEDICDNLWIPNCPKEKDDLNGSKLCKAKAHALGNELNLVSNRLKLNALLAGAVTSDSAFNNLGLDSNSTVGEAMIIIEAIIADSNSTDTNLSQAGYVASRIYNFYEEENPNAPFCIFNLSELSSPIINKSFMGSNNPIESPVEPVSDNTSTTTEEALPLEEPAVEDIPGCTDPEADNYNAEATLNDESCTYTILGCMDPEADNYNAEATLDDESCVYIILLGCTDPLADNYNPDVTEDDGSCTYPLPEEEPLPEE